MVTDRLTLSICAISPAPPSPSTARMRRVTFESASAFESWNSPKVSAPPLVRAAPLRSREVRLPPPRHELFRPMSPACEQKCEQEVWWW